MKRPITGALALLLALVMLTGMAFAAPVLTVGAPTGGYSDVTDHWGEDSITRWTDAGVATGDADTGTFRPDDEMTRGEVAEMLVNLLKLTEEGDLSGFTDIPADHPHRSALAKCVKAGYLKGRGNGIMDPNGNLPRQDLLTLFGRAMNVAPKETADKTFVDSDQVANYAEGYINALADLGAVNGVGGNVLDPKTPIDRASVYQLLDNVVTTYVSEDNAEVTVSGEDQVFVLVVADQVTVSGEVPTLVVGGTDNTVTVDGKADNATVLGAGAQLKVEGTVTNAKVSESAVGAVVTVAETATVETVETAAAQSKVEVSGTVTSVAVAESAAGAAVSVAETATVETVETAATETKVEVSGIVTNVAVAETAGKTEVTTGDNAKVENLDTKGEGVTVGGTGTVTNATVSGNDTKVETSGTKVEVAEGTTGTTAGGEAVEGGTTTETKPVEPTPEPTPEPEPEPTPEPPHVHSYARSVVKAATCSETGRASYTCSCGDTYYRTISKKDHTPGAEADCTTAQTCTVCGTQLNAALGHEWGEWFDLGDDENPTQHQRNCMHVGCEESQKEDHRGGTATCAALAVCEVCNSQYGEFGACVYDGGLYDKTDEGHKALCDLCGSVAEGDYEAHTGGTATCTARAECEVCGHGYGEVAEHTLGDAPTCVSSQICTVCKVVINGIDVNAHTPGAAATCTTAQICTLCETELVAALGHTEEIIPGKDATCTETGLTEGKKCSVCNEVLVAQEVVPVTEHTYKDLVCTECYAIDSSAVATIGSGVDIKAYGTLDEAIEAANNGAVVQLEKDIALNAMITIEKTQTITLDLNGYTVSYDSSVAASDAAITNKGTLTIQDSAEAGTGKITYTSTAPSTNNSYATNTITNMGTLTVRGGTIENATASGASYAIDNNSTVGDAILTIYDGTVTSLKDAIRQFANSTEFENNVVIEGGSISGIRAAYIHLPGSSKEVKLANLTVSGGTLIGKADSSGYITTIYSYSFGDNYNGVTVDISGGTFNGDVYFHGGSSNGGTGSEVVAISGGTFLGEVGTYGAASGYTAAITVTGGTFSSDPSDYLAEGYRVERNWNKTEFVVTAGTGEVITIANAEELRAFAAAANEGNTSYAGKTIKLTSNIDLAGEAWTPICATWPNVENGPLKNLVFDGNGKTISNMTIVAEEGDTNNGAYGFFGYVVGAIEFKNVSFDKAKIDVTKLGNYTYSGVLAGKIHADMKLSNVVVSDCEVRSSWQGGGVVGFAGDTPSLELTNCVVKDSFFGGYNATVGAIFGLGQQITITVNDCTIENVDLYTDNGLVEGGILGHKYSGTIFEGTGNTITNCVVVTAYPD